MMACWSLVKWDLVGTDSRVTIIDLGYRELGEHKCSNMKIKITMTHHLSILV